MESKRKKNDENAILEVTRLIKEFQEKFSEKTSREEQFMTISELEKLWSELRNNTDVLYSEMVRQLINTIDEKDIIRKKKENTQPKE